MVAMMLAAAAAGAAMNSPPIAVLIGGLAILAMLPASLSVTVRRLHDLGLSGWWLLVNVLPLGGLLLLLYYCKGGENGPNDYGDDPKSLGNTKATEERLVVPGRPLPVQALEKRRVKSLDGALTIYSDRDLNSAMVASPCAGTEIQLGVSSEVEGREWVVATLTSGESGYALAPNIRSHSTFVERTDA